MLVGFYYAVTTEVLDLKTNLVEGASGGAGPPPQKTPSTASLAGSRPASPGYS